MEAKGVEPSFPACKAGALPLSYAPKYWWTQRGSNPRLLVANEAVSRLILWARLGQLGDKATFLALYR